MTTPDPSREAFERHILSLNACTRLQRQSDQCGGAYRTVSVERSWKLWQAAMAHKCADLWQPIATAPRDGTRVLLATLQDKTIAGAGNWVERHKIWLWPYPLVEPTHWAPLPAAPKQEGSA